MDPLTKGGEAVTDDNVRDWPDTIGYASGYALLFLCGLGPGRIIRGDEPFPKLRTFCTAISPPSPLGLMLFCTLPGGHAGPHTAQGTDDEVLATWANETEAADNAERCKL